MNNIFFRPLPVSEPPFQSGITDPRFPLLAPQGLEDNKDYELYKGLVDKQKFCTVIKANVGVQNNKELKRLLQILSKMMDEEINKKASRKHLMPLDHERVPDSWRVTITLAFGVTLFVDSDGNDRFGLASSKPKDLAMMPVFAGDDFLPEQSCSDLMLIISSDHQYINVAITRYFAEYTNGQFNQAMNKDVEAFKIIDVQQGFGRPDSREFLKFNDGIDNLRSDLDLERLVYVDDECSEPSWCIGGSYLVYKKIREMMPVWEHFAQSKQEGMIGREKKSSLPLSKLKAAPNDLTPVYPDPTDDSDGPLDAHIRKVQPRRPEPDLFGINDLDRRFLRRPYPFFDGIDENGNSINGLLFVAYMKSIQQQFEHVTNMWQMNPDFPVKNTGVDALYSHNVLKNIDGAYYFCPPAPLTNDGFIGSGLFEENDQKTFKIPEVIYGFGITFIDIDETIFKTFAEVKVYKGDELIRVLDNQEFNDDELKDGERYDFGEFRDAHKFLTTSKPIIPVIMELKSILRKISTHSKGSRIVFLTARSDFDDKEKFLNTFRKYGIDIDSTRMYVERSGNLSTGTVAEKKKKVVLKYLNTGKYRRVRLIDDNLANLDEFLTIENELSEDTIELIKKTHHLNSDEIKPIVFSAYHIHNHHMIPYTGEK